VLLNRAELPRPGHPPARPYHALAVLEERAHDPAGELGILREAAVLPACQPSEGADPKRAIAGDQQLVDFAAGELLAARRRPLGAANAIEAAQAEFGAEPEIAVGRLRDRINGAFGNAVADLPGVVLVLVDVQRGIQRERARANGQDGRQYAGEGNNTSTACEIHDRCRCIF